MDLVYYDPYPNAWLEDYVAAYGRLLESKGERAVSARRCETVEEVLRAADVVSLHCNLDGATRHLINAERLRQMKPDAVLVSRGARRGTGPRGAKSPQQRRALEQLAGLPCAPRLLLRAAS